MLLSNLSIRDAEYVLETAPSTHVFHVRDPHALVQAAGYLKFKNGSGHGEGVYFRGETKLHGSLSPTLFRGVSTQAGQAKRINLLTKAIEEIRKGSNIFSSFPEAAHEALLQHYGFRTSWIDLVDNVWVALWFACHRARASGRLSEYLHFEIRSPHKEPNGHAYILLVAADHGKNTYQSAGVHVGKNTELIDLRVTAPSIFLRPHAQHGLLFRVRGGNVMRPIDYGSQIRGILRIALPDALAWLGSGQMLGVHALFPPPYYDYGYNLLLDQRFPGNKTVGAIAHVGS